MHNFGNAAPAKFASVRPYAVAKEAGRRLWQHAKAAPRLQANEPDRVYTEQVNTPFLFKDSALPAEYTAGMAWLIAEGCIEMDDSGCFFVLHPKGHDLFAAA